MAKRIKVEWEGFPNKATMILYICSNLNLVYLSSMYRMNLKEVQALYTRVKKLNKE